MGVVRRLIKYLFITLLILALASPLWVNIVPAKFLSSFTGKFKVVDKIVCKFTTQVRGKSMSPLIASGSSLELNRCFEAGDLVVGTIVMYDDNSSSRLGIIRHVLPLNPIVYKVSDEKAPQLLRDLVREEIVAITKNVDTSNSGYQTKQEAESFILDANEFLIDFYLASIPRGMGIESSTVKKTHLFSRQDDKFCSVIVPKKKIIGVDTEIFDIKAQKTILLGKDIIFGTNPSPNINCHEFGSGHGMLDLSPGLYRYRFLVNHQALADIEFEVK